ncbi:MAG: DNA-binding transcriptional ArsR family regulator [Candidatus Saccharimonadales bacterium]|jgi:DNA-binding transcriptional ArsR family regulator
MNCTQEELDEIFEALANDHRRNIIYTLGLQPRSISQLAEQEGLSFPAMYKHIKILETTQLIQRKKSGRTNFLALNKNRLQIVQEWLAQYHTHWGNQEETLENYVASIRKADSTIATKK